MSKSKRVLFVTSSFPTGDSDPNAPWLGMLARKLSAQRRTEVEVFAPAVQGGSDHAYHGIRVFRFRYAIPSWEILTQKEGAVFKLRDNPLLYLLLFSYFIGGIVRIALLCRSHRYDIIHVHWPFPQLLFGIVAKKLTGARLVATFYGAEFTILRKVPFGRALLSTLMKHVDRVAAISSYTKHLVTDLTTQPVAVVPFTSPLKEQKGHVPIRTHNGKRHVLFVGRLIDRKGIAYLISALTHLPQNVVLEIVGTGPLARDLKQLVLRLGLEHHVRFHGHVNNTKLDRLYRSCDVFVLPAISDRWGDTEGLGVVLLEAMSYDKPVVATNVGGIVDIITHEKTGLLVRQKDPEALAGAIGKILGNTQRAQKLARQGASFVRQEFGWGTIVDKIGALYGITSSTRSERSSKQSSPR